MHKRFKESKMRVHEGGGLSVDVIYWGVAGYKYLVLFSHEICHQKFSDRKAGSLEEEIENCA